jgi:hypothetical protein
VASDLSLWKAQYLQNFFDDSEYGKTDYKALYKGGEEMKKEEWRRMRKIR